MFFKQGKGRLRVALLVILSMLMQSLSPAVPVLAAAGGESFRITEERVAERVAYLDWELTLDPEDTVADYSYQGDFTLEEAAAGELRSQGGLRLGSYQVTTGGALTVNLVPGLYEDRTAGEDTLREGEAQESSPEESSLMLLTGTITVPGAEASPGLLAQVMGLLGTGRDLGDIFTFKDLWLGEGESKTSISESTPVELDGNDRVTIRYEWDIRGRNAQSGDTASIRIPGIFNSAGDYPQAPLLLSNGAEVGTYTVNNGILQFTFGEGLNSIDTDTLEDTFIELGFGLRMAELEEDINQVIEFGDSLNKTFNLAVKPGTPAAQELNKVGVPDGTGNDGKKDAKKITWTIDVLNTEETALEGAVLKEEEIPAGLALAEGSFQITPLTMGYNGAVSLKGEPTGIAAQPKDGGFAIALPELAPYSGCRITYITNITDFSAKAFTNTAKLTKGAGVEPLTAQGTVTDLTRSAPLEKSSQVLSNGDIQWTLDVNKGGISIAEPVIEDVLPPGLAIKEVDGAKVVKVFKRQAGGQYEPVPGSDVSEFPDHLELPAIGAEDVYRIVYTTTIDYGQVNGGNYQKVNDFTNSATLADGGITIGEPVTAEATVTRADLLAKDGAVPVRYGDTLSWTITVNQAYHSIGNAVLHDKIPTGLKFDPDAVTVKKKAKGQAWIKLEGAEKPSVSELADREVTVNLGDITDEYEITYTTPISDPGSFAENTTFQNKAWLTGTHLGTGPGSGTISGTDYSVTKGLTPPDNSYSKTADGIDYDARTIAWKIEIDPIKEPLTELKIEDSFPNKGLLFLPESLEIWKGSASLDSGYTLTPREEGGTTGYQKGFVITFANGTSETPILTGQKLIITYKTSYDPQCKVEENNRIDRLEPYTGPEEKEYKNVAEITGQTKSGQSIAKTLPATALSNQDTDSPSWNSGKKTGSLVHREGGEMKTGWTSGADRFIQWKIYINYLNQNLGEQVSVTDTLGYEGEIDLASVQIKKYTVNSTTGDTQDGEAAEVNYTPSLSNGGKTLNIGFNEAVEQRYVIIYHTSVPDTSQESYTNNAQVQVGGSNGITTYPYQGAVSYAQAEAFVDKKALINGNKVYTDDELGWEIVVNQSLSANLEDVVVTDTIAPGMVFVQGSLAVKKLEEGSYTEVPAGETGVYTLVESGDQTAGTTLTLAFNQPISHQYQITYKTVVTATSGNVSNNAQITGSQITGEKSSGKTYSAERFGSTGGIIGSKGKLRILKMDPEGRLITGNPVPAVFKLWYDLNGSLVPFDEGREFSTADGAIEIPNLSLREYHLEEVKAPQGFEELADKIRVTVNKAFQNNEGNVIQIEVENQKIKTDITATKIWQDNQPGPKPTIWLKLYRQIGSDQAAEVPGAELKALPDGTTAAVWTDMDKTDSQGRDYTYSVKEADAQGQICTPEGYMKTEDGLTVTNTRLVRAVKLIKTDVSDSNQKLAGAKFHLYDSSGNPVTADGDGTLLPDEFITDGHGEITVNNLAPGSYYFREAAPPPYYLLPEEAQRKSAEFTITADQVQTAVVEMTNTRGTGSILITKVDEETRTPLEGVKFALTRKSGASFSTDPEDTARMLVTDREGQATLESLPYDTYILQETEAHPDYVPASQEWEVVLTGEGTDAVKEVTIGNTPKDHSVKLTKYNGERSLTLAGAVFELRKKEGSLGEYTRVDGLQAAALTTNGQGQIHLPDLAPGDYQLVEVQAPAGYRLDSSPQAFTIGENQSEPVALTMTNSRIIYNGGGGGIPATPIPQEPSQPAPQEPDGNGPVPGEPIRENTLQETPKEGAVQLPPGSTVKISVLPLHGQVTVDEEGQWRYTPEPGFAGKDQFNITILKSDGTQEDILIEIDVDKTPLGAPQTPGTDKGNQEQLPKTGESSKTAFYLAGWALMLGGWMLRRKAA